MTRAADGKVQAHRANNDERGRCGSRERRDVRNDLDQLAASRLHQL
jgi:hypothetical protein